MKKVLLGTTALLAAGMFAGPALGQARTAMTATNFNLTLGGFTTFRFEYQNRSPSQNITGLDADGTLADEPRNHNLDFDAELEFRGAATLSTGLKAGFEIELEAGGTDVHQATCGITNVGTTAAGGTATTITQTNALTAGCVDFIDDNFLYVDGRLGKVTMGGFTVTNLDVGVARTYSSAGGISLTDDEGNALAVAGGNQASFTQSLNVNNGRNRIMYEPPALAGFRLMLAYAPDLSQENTTGTTQQDDGGVVATATVAQVAAQAHQDIHISTQWAGSLMGNRTRVSFGWASAAAENNDPTAVGISANSRWRVGADIVVGGITVGGYYKAGKDNAVTPDATAIAITGATNTDAVNAGGVAGVNVDEDTKLWGIGGVYRMGVWEFGLGYEKAEQEELGLTYVAPGTGKDVATRWDFGVQYTGLGRGRTIIAGIRQEKWEDDMNNQFKESKTRSVDVQYNWDVAPGLEFDLGYTNYRYTHHAGLDPNPVTRSAHGVKVQTKLTF